MPRALAPGLLLFIGSLLRAQACFLHKKQMEEQKRAKATKPFWVSIVLPAWGAEWEWTRLFVRVPDSMREEHISRQRILAPFSSTASWSCQEGEGRPPPSPCSSHLLRHDDFSWLQDIQISVLTVFADEAPMGSAGCMCARTNFSPIAHRAGLPCWADFST